MGELERPRLLLVRHTETAWSRSGRHTGSTDLPLDSGGRAHAAALRPVLASESITIAYSSPLRRAYETAELAGFAKPFVLDELAEWNYGIYEGRTTAEIRQERPDWELFADGCPAGESAEQVGVRVDRALEVILAAANGATVAIFSHGHLLRVLAARWIGLAPQNGRCFALDPGGLSRLAWERSTHIIASWNLQMTITGGVSVEGLNY